MSKFKLGPVQEAWLAALENNKFRTGHGVLYDASADAYCCLGVGATVIGEDCVKMLGRGWLSDKARDALGLFDASGAPTFRADADNDLPGCIAMNDSLRMTFPAIAAHLRANAKRYFKRSK